MVKSDSEMEPTSFKLSPNLNEQNGTQMVPQNVLGGVQMDQKALRWFKRYQDGLKEIPINVQDGPERTQDSSKGEQHNPKTTQDGAKRTQDGPKMAQRRSQEASKESKWMSKLISCAVLTLRKC